MASFLEVVGPILGKQGSRRVLDYCYGPDAKSVRRDMMAIAYAEPTLTKSDKRCQWGLFRKKLLAVAGVNTFEGCIATQDHAFNERYESLLDTIAAGILENSQAEPLPATEIEIVIPADYDLGEPVG